MAATRIVSGTLREVWREDVALDGGASAVITTSIPAYNLARVSGTGFVTAASGAPKLSVTTSVVADRLVATVANTAPAGNLATFLLDISYVISPQQSNGSYAPAPIPVVYAGSGTSDLLIVPTMADLYALPTPVLDGCLVRLLGYHAVDDGGAGFFVWHAASILTDDKGMIVKPTAVSGAGRWLRTIPGWDWAQAGTGQIGEVEIAWFGAYGDGVQDDTLYVNRAITACRNLGTQIRLYFKRQQCKITQTLQLPIGTTLFTLRGEPATSLLAEDAPVATIHCQSIVGPVIDLQAPAVYSGPIGLSNIAFDGHNTLTCTGIFNQAQSVMYQCEIADLLIKRIYTNAAKALDISNWVLTRFERVRFVGIRGGYALYLSSNINSSTTLSFNTVEFYECRECIAGLSNSQLMTFTDCSFERSLVAIAMYEGTFLFQGCWFEDIGIVLDGIDTPLSKRPSDNTLIDSPIYLTGSVTKFQSCVFAYLNAGTPFSAWCEVDGRAASTYFEYGAVNFDQCFSIAQTDPFFTAATGTLGSFEINVTDALLLRAQSNFGIAHTYADIRKVTRGWVVVPFSAQDQRPAKVVAGRLEYGYYPDTAYTSGLTSAPLGGQNLTGDRVRIQAPPAGGFVGYICTVAGTPGTWEGYGGVSAPSLVDMLKMESAADLGGKPSDWDCQGTDCVNVPGQVSGNNDFEGMNYQGGIVLSSPAGIALDLTGQAQNLVQSKNDKILATTLASMPWRFSALINQATPNGQQFGLGVQAENGQLWFAVLPAYKTDTWVWETDINVQVGGTPANPVDLGPVAAGPYRMDIESDGAGHVRYRWNLGTWSAWIAEARSVGAYCVFMALNCNTAHLPLKWMYFLRKAR